MTLSDWADELFDMIRRRFWLIARIAFLGCVASLLFALSQVHQYTSTAVLQVQGARVAGALTPPTVGQVSARELQAVEQQIMARDRILETGARLGLLEGLAGLTENEKVTALREAVQISGVAAARAGASNDGEISLVRISATWDNRESAQALAREIARQTMEASARARLEQARETLAFFGLREDGLKARISELEEALARFRSEHGLPEGGTPAAQDREIEALRAEILVLERQMIVLEGEIARAEARGQLTRLEEQNLAKSRERLSGLAEQRDFLARSLEAVSNSGQRDPALQIRLAGHERELAALQEELRGVRESRKQAEIGYQLEAQGQSERLAILEPASWPDYPSTPSRAKMAALGAVASVLAALAAAYLLDLRNPVLRSAALMKRELGYAPIVTVPEAPQPGRASSLRRALRRRLRLG